MHELAVTQQLLQLALRQATQAHAVRILSVRVAVGDLSTFSEDALRFCWEHLTAGTPCAGAALDFRRVAAELTCRDCGGVHAFSGEPRPCPNCDSAQLEVTAGDDLVLESLEIETGADSDDAR